MKPYCCYISEDGKECENEATWTQWFSADQNDATEVCSEHRWEYAGVVYEQPIGD